MATKQTSAEMSSLAARVMNGYEPTREEIVSMAASLVSQDETPADDRSNPMVAEAKRLAGDAWGEPESQRENPLGR